MELLADLLIVSAVIMLTIMWDLWIAELFTSNWKGQTFGDRLFGAGMAVGAFAFFYLSPRFLFLIEDFNRRLTWATLALTVAPLIGRILLAAVRLSRRYALLRSAARRRRAYQLC